MKKKLLVICCLSIFAINAFSQTFNSGVINSKIPNTGVGLTLTLNVSGLPSVMNNTFGLESLCLSISHTSVNNIEAYLVASNGIQVQLTTQNGGKDTNYTGTCFSMDATQSVINGVAPFTGSYKPQGDFGAVNNGNPNGTWKLIIVDILPSDSDSGKVVSWSLKFGNAPAKALTLSSNLPLIKINTLGQFIDYDKEKVVDFEIINNTGGNRNNLDDAPAYKGKISIHSRGSTSIQFPKKSFTINTLNASGDKELDTSLIGLPREHSWILHAPYVDKSLIRNVLSYELYSKIGHYSTRTRYVELVLNGQYQGVYVLIEKIKRDKKRVNVEKLKQTEISGDALTGGYIIKIDRLNSTGPSFGWSSSIASQGGKKIFFQYHYPSEDSIMPQQESYIKSFIDSFETALNNEDFDLKKGYRKFMSITSFMDFFLMNELTKNIDGYRLSTFLQKDKITKVTKGKLMMGPLWDYELGWHNANANGGNVTDGWEFSMLNDSYPIPFWWGKITKDPIFWNDARCRLNMLKSSVFNTGTINRVVDSLSTLLSEAQERNFQQWPILSKNVYNNPEPVPGSFLGEMTSIKNWAKARLTWLDYNIKGDINNCPITSIEEELKEEIAFSVFPNPFPKSFTINYELKKTSNFSIELYNVIGERVGLIPMVSKIPGNYSQNIEIPSLPAGIYFIRARAGDLIINQKIVKTL
jgi:hypothetical protein